MSKRSKACDINKSVKDTVWERDGHKCVICGSRSAMPNAHFIPRSHGGLGIEENIVTLCQRCHDTYDKTTLRETYGAIIERYLQEKYFNWSIEKLRYNKYDKS